MYIKVGKESNMGNVEMSRGIELCVVMWFVFAPSLAEGLAGTNEKAEREELLKGLKELRDLGVAEPA